MLSAMSDDARRARARARRQRMTVLFAPADATDDAAPLRGAEAMAHAVELSRMAWLLSGRPLPEYSRADMPIRFVERR